MWQIFYTAIFVLVLAWFIREEIAWDADRPFSDIPFSRMGVLGAMVMLLLVSGPPQ